jgi:hypothetical protein
MTTFGNKAAELIAEAAVADDAALPVYNVRRCCAAFKPCSARETRRRVVERRDALTRARDARRGMRRST